MFSDLIPTADIHRGDGYVSFVPNPEVVRFGVATLIHDVGASPQSHIGRSESEIAAPYSDPDLICRKS